VLVERLENKEMGDLFAQRFSAFGGAARSAETALQGPGGGIHLELRDVKS
jgi:hypothetical protein